MMDESKFIQPPQIAQLGAIDLGTPNLRKSLEFFRDLLGMEVTHETEDRAYLRCYQELQHHSLILTQTPEAVARSYSFRTQRPEDVERFYEKFLREELEVLELPAGHQQGRGTAIRFLWPGAGHPIELYYDIEKPLADESIRSLLPSNSSRRRGLGVRRIDHYNMQTNPGAVAQAERWARENLGLKRREFIRGVDSDDLLVSWMSNTFQGHDVAIGGSVYEESAQLHHVAFNLENFHDMLTAAETLRDSGIEIFGGPGKHGIGQAMYLYVRDPGSGHRIELYSGGYQIMEPDWEPIEWPLDLSQPGITFFGDPVVMAPGEPFASTTPSAGLDPAKGVSVMA